MSWANLQSDFVQAMVRGDATKMVQHIDLTRLTPKDSLHVYRNNVMLSLIDVLAEKYRAVQTLVGEVFFAQMAQHFIQQHPPDSGDLNQYGQGFASFVEHYESAQSLSYLPDMARYEWAWSTSFFAADDMAIDPNVFSQMDEAQLFDTPFPLRCCVQLLRSAYPLDAIWRYCVQQGGEGEPPDMTPDVYCLLLHRVQRKVRCRRLDAATYEGLRALQDKRPLGEVVSCYMKHAEQANPTTFLSFVLQEALVCEEDK